jgi:hypothetical protein
VSSRVIPHNKIEEMRFFQLLVAALRTNGNLEFRVLPPDENGVEERAYVVTGVDPFFLENDELEKILQKFLGADKQ